MHIAEQIFFCQTPFLFPKNFSFQKLLQNTYFLENYLISKPCQNELTRLLSMYSSLLSTEGESSEPEKKYHHTSNITKLQDFFCSHAQ